MIFPEGRGGVTGTLTKWEKDVDVLVAISSPLILVGKNVVKLRPSEAAILGRYEKYHT